MHPMSRRFGLLLIALPALLFPAGCRKAEVERTTNTVTPTIHAGAPAYVLRPKTDSRIPWYREMQVVFNDRPADEKELESYITENEAPVQDAVKQLLKEIVDTVEAQRRPADKWSLISIWCGRVKKGGEITVIADVGLTRLFTPRPVIAFQDLPLELAVAKLARETGITDSLPRGYSPRVTWSATNISVKDAYDGFLQVYGFERKFTDVSGRVTVRIQDFATRPECKNAVTDAIVAEGRRLNAAKGGIIVTPVDTTPKTEPVAPAAPTAVPLPK
jgi:hypothetical protein